MNCQGCKQSKSEVFWGTCEKAKCCIDKKLDHCGFCDSLPCDIMKELFKDKEHGDKGVRLRNLNNWNNGNFVFESLGNIS